MCRPNILFPVLLVATTLSISAPPASAQSDAGAPSDEAWGLEEAYWRHRKANDVDSFRTLWHPRALGWPSGEAPPVSMEQLIKWAFSLGDIVDYQLTREAVEVFRDTATTYYSVLYTAELRGQRTTRRTRITHALIKSAGRWQIVGGMAAELPIQQ